MILKLTRRIVRQENCNTIQRLALNFVKSRSAKDFKLLYDRIKPGLFIHVKNVVKDEQAAEDVLADAFVKMWERIDQYNEFWNFSTWAYKIAYNESLQWIRKNADTYSLDAIQDTDQVIENMVLADALAVDNGLGLIDEPDWYFDEDDEVALMYERVMCHIYDLPELYRGIMIDREINGMRYEDISIKYGLELNTVKTRIKRARNKICKLALEQTEDS